MKQIAFRSKLSQKRAKTAKSEASDMFRMSGRPCGRPEHSSERKCGRPVRTFGLLTQELFFGAHGLLGSGCPLGARMNSGGRRVRVPRIVRRNSGFDDSDARTSSRCWKRAKTT